MGEVSGAKESARPERGHLRREVRTALELAIVALAPTAIVEQLAMAAGLLEAIDELPPDTVKDITESITRRAVVSLERWNEWRPNRIPDPA